jgi:hypothetical protein
MASIEEDIFTGLKTAFASDLSWVKKINVDDPILEMDQLQNNQFPYIQIIWDKPSTQQPLRGLTETTASFLVQVFDKATSKSKVTQFDMFEHREDVKNSTMGAMTSIKALNQKFYQFSYQGRLYDIHSFPGVFLTEVYFDAKYNETYGDC